MPDTAMKIYLSGPITGIPDSNRPLFASVAADLRRRGYDVVSPIEHDHLAAGNDWSDYLRKDLRLIADCDAIAVLPKWNRSRGARLEVYIAITLGMPVLECESMEACPITVASEPVFSLSGINEGALG